MLSEARRVPRVWWDSAATLAAVLVVGAPALFTHDGFEYDFTNHLWLVWIQEQSIYHHHAAAYFTNTEFNGVFYPFYIFYGGTLYVITGAAAAVLGQRVTLAYVGSILLGIAASYAGLVWLGRQLGVRSWLAHASAVTYVASAYFVTNLYGRGAWPEFMATSAIPMLLASGWSLAYGPRVGLLPSFLFVVSTVIFSGSHNVTLLLGTIASISTIALVVLAVGRRLVPSRWRLATTGLLFGAGVLVNAWFLLPDLLYESRTAIARVAPVAWTFTAEFNTLGVFFNPLRGVPRHLGTPALYLQLPDWFLLWVVGVMVGTWSTLGRRLKRVFAALAFLFAITMALILVQPLWNALPSVLRQVQFPYRLSTYAVFFVSGLVMVSALALERLPISRWGQILQRSLVGVMGVSVGLCVWQLWVPRTHDVYSYSNRDSVFVSTHIAPRTWYDGGDYNDVSARPVSHITSAAPVSPVSVNSNEVHLTLTPPPGNRPFLTDIAGGPYVVQVTGGATFYGRKSPGFDGRTGSDYEVLRRTRKSRGPIVVTIKPAGGALSTGRVLSELAVAALAVWFVAASAAEIRRRRQRSSAAAPA